MRGCVLKAGIPQVGIPQVGRVPLFPPQMVRRCKKRIPLLPFCVGRAWAGVGLPTRTWRGGPGRGWGGCEARGAM